MESIVKLGKSKGLKRYDLCQFWEIKEEKTKNLISTLREDKLYAFVTKNLASEYLKKLKSELESKLQVDKNIITEIGFSNSTPLISWRKTDKEYSQGIQIQNGQFRFFVMSEDKKSPIGTNLLDKWIETWTEQFIDWNPLLSKRKYNKFGDWFKYKYTKITSEDELKTKLEQVFEHWGIKS